MSDLPLELKLNVGCGNENPQGWVNIDGSWQARLADNSLLLRVASWLTGRKIARWQRGIVHHDIRRGLKHTSGTVAVVYSSHTIEHIHRNEAIEFLREVYRVLKPGGVCRIVVPDLSAIIGWYLEHRTQSSESKQQPSSDLLMSMLCIRPQTVRTRQSLLDWYRRMTDFEHHKWMYDEEGLKHIFREAGFLNPQAKKYLESLIPTTELAVVEKADRVLNGAGVCVEAQK